jgi:hypothetical protein
MQSIAWSLRKTTPTFPLMENVDLASFLLAGIQFGQVSQYGEQYTTNGMQWADM